MQTATDIPATKRYRSTFYGAVAGAVIALILTALFGGMTALGSVDALVLDEATSRARPEFVVTNGAMYFLVVVVSLIGGTVVASLTYAFNRQAAGESELLPLRYLLPTGAITAAIVAYIVLRAGLGAVGDITAGVVTVSVFRLLIIIVLSGAVAGAATAGTVDALARPSFLAIEGEAVPVSMQSFVREMLRAVSGPLIGTLLAAGFAIALSQVLLAIQGLGAVAIFSVVGAVVLGGATLLALRPWERANGKSDGASS